MAVAGIDHVALPTADGERLLAVRHRGLTLHVPLLRRREAALLTPDRARLRPGGVTLFGLAVTVRLLVLPRVRLALLSGRGLVGALGILAVGHGCLPRRGWVHHGRPTKIGRADLPRGREASLL
jgi:hypothetical protein